MKKILDRLSRYNNFKGGIIPFFFHHNYFVNKWIAKWVKTFSHLLSGKVLDFGCGSKPYKNTISHIEYIGVDIKISGHDHKNEYIDVFYDGKTLPFEDAYFDSIFSTEVFEHVSNLPEILTELSRVIRPGWVLLCTMPFIWPEHEQPFDFQRYTSFDIIHNIENVWFTCITHMKTTTAVETIFQLWNNYLGMVLFTENRLWNIFCQLVCIMPSTLIWSILSLILPKKSSIYHTNVVVFKKK